VVNPIAKDNFAGAATEWDYAAQRDILRFTGHNIESLRAQLKISGEEILTKIGNCGRLRLLDCGCGPGFYEVYWAEHFAEIVAADRSRAMLSIAKSRLSSLGLHGVNLILCDAHHLPFRERSFDAMVCAGLVKHLTPNPGSTLALLSTGSRLLRKGGVLYANDMPRLMHANGIAWSVFGSLAREFKLFFTVSQYLYTNGDFESMSRLRAGCTIHLREYGWKNPVSEILYSFAPRAVKRLLRSVFLVEPGEARRRPWNCLSWLSHVEVILAKP